MSDIVYLDICCFKRPFDDATLERVRQEAEAVAAILDLAATITVSASPQASQRARALADAGFGPLDALHLAFAEQSASKWFLTTDDRLLKRARANPEGLQVRVVRPDEFPLPSEGDK